MLFSKKRVLTSLVIAVPVLTVAYVYINAAFLIMANLNEFFTNDFSSMFDAIGGALIMSFFSAVVILLGGGVDDVLNNPPVDLRPMMVLAFLLSYGLLTLVAIFKKGRERGAV